MPPTSNPGSSGEACGSGAAVMPGRGRRARRQRRRRRPRPRACPRIRQRRKGTVGRRVGGSARLSVCGEPTNPEIVLCQRTRFGSAPAGAPRPYDGHTQLINLIGPIRRNRCPIADGTSSGQSHEHGRRRATAIRLYSRRLRLKFSGWTASFAPQWRWHHPPERTKSRIRSPECMSTPPAHQGYGLELCTRRTTLTAEVGNLPASAPVRSPQSNRRVRCPPAGNQLPTSNYVQRTAWVFVRAALGKKYEAYVETLSSRDDLNYILQQMLGDLTASHLCGGGAVP